MFFCQIEYSAVGPLSQLLLTTATPSHSYGYVKDHTTFGWTDSKKWVRDFGTIHLGRSQNFHTFWPLPPLPVGSFTTFCRQISIKFDPYPPSPNCRRPKWMVSLVFCQKGDHLPNWGHFLFLLTYIEKNTNKFCHFFRDKKCIKLYNWSNFFLNLIVWFRL